MEMEIATTAGTVLNNSGEVQHVKGTSLTLEHVEYFMLPLLLLFGIVGNWLTIRVMRMASFRALAVSKMFISMSLSDIVVNLLLPFNKSYIRQALGVDVRAFSDGGCKLFFWTYRFAKTTSSWMVVLITLERFVAVWLPIKARSMNTERNVYIAMAALYGTLAVFFGYWSSWSDRIIGDTCIINSRPVGYEYLSEVFLLCGIILYSVAPAVLLLTFNSLIVYKLVALRRKIAPEVKVKSSSHMQQKNSSGCSKSAQNSRTTVMLLSVAISFVLLVTPNAVAHVLFFVKKEAMFETTNPVMVALSEAAQTLEQINHSIHFTLYVVCNKRFRDGVTSLFKPKRPESTSSGSLPIDASK